MSQPPKRESLLKKRTRPATNYVAPVVIPQPEPPATSDSTEVDVTDTKSTPTPVLVSDNQQIKESHNHVIAESEPNDSSIFLDSLTDQISATKPRIPPAPKQDQLLYGAFDMTHVYLIPKVTQAIEAMTVKRKGGEKVTRTTIIGHALNYGLENRDQWLESCFVDGRRTGAHGIPATVTGLQLPIALEEHIDALAAGLRVKHAGDAPSKKALKLVAVTWAMTKVDKWRERLLIHPISRRRQ